MARFRNLPIRFRPLTSLSSTLTTALVAALAALGPALTGATATATATATASVTAAAAATSAVGVSGAFSGAFGAASLTAAAVAFMAAPAPALAMQSMVALKYPIDVHPLSTENGYIRQHPAPDYWRLSPHLSHQATNSSCSLAAATLVLNGARDSSVLSKEEPELSEQSVLKKTKSAKWRKAVAEDGGGISLVDFAPIFQSALIAHGFTKATAELMSAHSDSFETGLNSFIDALTANEASSDDFIIVNFDQGVVMEHGESVGHFAPVGAYDASTQMVLILDSDREWYEPYWVPVRKLYTAMFERRGYLKVNFSPK